jgi:hypothetical protein
VNSMSAPTESDNAGINERVKDDHDDPSTNSISDDDDETSYQESCDDSEEDEESETAEGTPEPEDTVATLAEKVRKEKIVWKYGAFSLMAIVGIALTISAQYVVRKVTMQTSDKQVSGVGDCLFYYAVIEIPPVNHSYERFLFRLQSTIFLQNPLQSCSVLRSNISYNRFTVSLTHTHSRPRPILLLRIALFHLSHWSGWKVTTRQDWASSHTHRLLTLRRRGLPTRKQIITGSISRMPLLRRSTMCRCNMPTRIH